MNKKSLLIICTIAFILNISREFAHHFLYIDLSGIPIYFHLFIASLVDTFIIISIFLLISLKNKTLNWLINPTKIDYILIIIISILIAILIESTNLRLGRWQYTSFMPTIFGIGISPLFQLAVTGVISLVIGKYLKKS
ncbi:MAG: hypothetical protein WC850_04700 [Candidatus Gracilibacteria bacterium]